MRAHGSKGVLAAERNAKLIAVDFVFGLLSHEVLALKIRDFDASEQAPEYGPFAICQIRDHRVPIDPPLIRAAPALPGYEFIAEEIRDWTGRLRRTYHLHLAGPGYSVGFIRRQTSRRSANHRLVLRAVQ